MCNSDEINKCRICLKTGKIPIYGENCKSDISFEVRTFGDIDLFENDEYPKYICSECLKLLHCAILFRNTAKRSDSILKGIRKPRTEPNSCEKVVIPNTSIIPSNLSSSSEVIQNHFKEVRISASSDRPNKICRSKLTINRVQCSVCHKIIIRRHARDHYALHDPSLSKYICDICGKAFRQRSGCVNHRQTHSKEFKFKCNICPYKANTSSLLKLHARTHTGDYRYMCTKCPARFLTKSNFNKHSLKHKEPQLKCDYCKKQFHSKTPLESHIQTVHFGLKSHVCNTCGEAYGNRKSLVNHQVKVHERKKGSTGRLPAYLKAQMQEQRENEVINDQ